MGVQVLPTGVYGPLPEGTMGLVLGRNSTLLRGICILPDVIDADYKGEIKILTTVERGMLVVPQGDRIAQLVLLPQVLTNNPSLKEHRENQDFGSTGTCAFWVATLQNRPQLKLNIEGKTFLGILDTDADVSVLSYEYWPKHWDLEETLASLQGIGQASPQKSAKILKWQDNEGHEGFFQPFILQQLPTNLWGRDVVQEMGAVLTTQPRSQDTALVTTIGWIPGQGLGHRHQGGPRALQVTDQGICMPGDRRGFGHF